MVIALAMVLIATNVFRGPILKTHSHRAKTEAKVKISLMVVAYSLIFDGCSSIFFVFAWWEQILAQLRRSGVNENIFHIANALAQCQVILIRNPIFSLTLPVTTQFPIFGFLYVQPFTQIRPRELTDTAITRSFKS